MSVKSVIVSGSAMCLPVTLTVRGSSSTPRFSRTLPTFRELPSNYAPKFANSWKYRLSSAVPSFMVAEYSKYPQVIGLEEKSSSST